MESQGAQLGSGKKAPLAGASGQKVGPHRHPRAVPTGAARPCPAWAGLWLRRGLGLCPLTLQTHGGGGCCKLSALWPERLKGIIKTAKGPDDTESFHTATATLRGSQRRSLVRNAAAGAAGQPREQRRRLRTCGFGCLRRRGQFTAVACCPGTSPSEKVKSQLQVRKKIQLVPFLGWQAGVGRNH